MNGIDPAACKFALSKIADGLIFEEFSQRFLSAILGHSFLPVGGIKDRGIDGLEHLYQKSGTDRIIYQASIEKDPEFKVARTLAKLRANKIRFERFTYVTNQEVPSKDKIIDELMDRYRKTAIQIYDLAWFAINVNGSSATVNAYNTFVESYLHEFQKPGGSYVIGDLIRDPRLYVFLRQQWESNKGQVTIDEILADTLILYALEGTDPDKGILKTREQIIQDISRHLKFEPKLLSAQIARRLEILSRKPDRKIVFHATKDAYCLPYTTRQELVEKNFKDAALHQAFRDEATVKLKKFLRDDNVRVQDCVELIDATLNKIFYKQGLEFSELLRSGNTRDTFEKSLPDTISEAVDESGVTHGNRQAVKSALLYTIRDIIYDGTIEQKQFLKCLSNTYMLLFLLQCDPKVSLYFSTMASKLEVFVCTSIIVPALSEYYLEPENRRYWNLLVGAKTSGVKFKANDDIIDELVAHFRRIKTVFRDEFSDCESLYDDEMTILYIREILIRAYFYAKLRGRIRNFDEFIDAFCNPNLQNAKQELIDWLGHEFGIEFVSSKSLPVSIDKGELVQLHDVLRKAKGDTNKARTDASLILTIFALRERNREASAQNWSGYKTWWLSSDTVTQRVVNAVFGDKYRIGCYMRPDFLYNYISLAPSATDVTDVYKQVFPNLLGVNISHNLPHEIMDTVGRFILDHKSKNLTRLKSTLREYSDKLKTDPNSSTRAHLEHFFNEEKRKYASV